ncbi:MAG: N-acetyltransferase [Acidimicrobiia bacterium]
MTAGSIDDDSPGATWVPGLEQVGPESLPEMQAILSQCLAHPDDRYTVHPGDLAWWLHHSFGTDWVDTTWVIPGEAVLSLEENDGEINLFARSSQTRMGLIEWAQHRLGHKAEVGWVADDDTELVSYLKGAGYEPAGVYRSYLWNLSNTPIPGPSLPIGWTLRHLGGEHEADGRRHAAHAAFESTMEPDVHLERYLRFMRSPVYVPERDLVAVSPEGMIAAFMVWWADDDTGIAQIEPFGTHPDFQRLGIGRALIYFGLGRMREAGMTATRVCTNEPRDAVHFYEDVGFDDVGRLRWWKPPGNAIPDLQ